MVDTNPESGVDESPISSFERRDSLEKHLQHRPDPQDLKDKHILLSTNVAPYGISLAYAPFPCYPHLLLLYIRQSN